jgi:hypothetical protein
MTLWMNSTKHPILLQLVQKIEEKGTVPNSFYEANIILTPKPKTPQENHRSLLVMNMQKLQ